MFGSGALIAGAIFLQMIMYAFHMLFGWDLHFNFIQICASLVYKYSLDSVAYLLDVTVFYTLSLTIWAILKQGVLSNRAYRKIKLYQNEQLTREMNKQYGSSADDLIIVDSREPLAFTMGFQRFWRINIPFPDWEHKSIWEAHCSSF